MTYPDNARYDSRYTYRVERAVDRDHEGCPHPRDMHWRYGCGAEHCECTYVPPAMNLVEAARILSRTDSPREGWLR